MFFKLNKKPPSYFYFGLLLFGSSILRGFILIKSGKNCITYFQGITQCGVSAHIGLSTIAICGAYLVFIGAKRAFEGRDTNDDE